MSDTTEPIQTIEGCDDDDDVRELIARTFNNLAIECMKHDFSPMIVAEATHDHGEKLKIMLHSSSAREQMGEDNDSEETDVFDDGGEHPLE